MTHYEHAVEISLKLGRWSNPKPLKNWEQEREDALQNSSGPPDDSARRSWRSARAIQVNAGLDC